MGTVLRDKRILAVVIKYTGINNSLNNPCDIHRINELAIKLHREIASLNEDKILKTCGTANYISLMNDAELLPVKNMQYGSDSEAKNIDACMLYKKYQKQYNTDGCWFGCSIACKKVIYDFKLRTGPYAGRKVSIDGPEYETLASLGANCGVFNLESILEMNFYCNTYGIDSVSYACIMAFLMECYERGIINNEFTGGHKLKFGNYKAMLSVLHEMAEGRGLGIVAAIGIQGIKELLVEEYHEDIDFLNDIGLVQNGIEFGAYMSKESLAQQGNYGITNKSPQHDQCWMISMDKIKNSIPTIENKAQALTIFPIFRTMFGIVGLCRLPWNNIIPLHIKDPQKQEGEIIKEHIKDYCLVYEAVTGSSMSLKEMMLSSERISTFQRLFNKRMGKGTREFDMLPYRAMGPVTQKEYLSKQELYDAQIRNDLNMDPDNLSTDKKIEILRTYRSKLYEELIDATYAIRGWDNNGVPTGEKLQKVGLGE
jgi:aldehyde:ferredoxin oxidoreductase